MLKAAIKPFVPAPIRKVPHLIRAGKERLTNKVEVPDNPLFDAGGLAFFKQRISSCSRYLEYGSGGSTVAVGRLNIPFTSVESDKRFLAAVKAKVGDGAERQFLAADIGMVSNWGYPLFVDVTPSRLAKWRKYPCAPWPLPALPDVILIDGRFRVACALATIKNLQDKIDFEILFDDYADRDFYHPIEEFAQLHAMHGRMAVFKPKPISAAKLDAAIERFETDYR
jgi:hypothetical protein